MNIKRSVNKFQIVGGIDEINLKVDDSLVSKKNPKIKGAIVKADFKNPSVTIDVGGQTIGVDFYPTYKQREKDGKIEDNPRYKALETIMNYEKGTRVKADCSVSENSYVDDKGVEPEFKTFPQLSAFQISSTNVPDEDKADGRISGIVKNITSEVNKDGDETGRIFIEFYYMTTDASGDISATPIKLICESDIADDFKEMYPIGSSCMLDVEIINKQVGGNKKKVEGHFGRRESKIVDGFSIEEYSIFGGDPAIEEENEYFIPIDDMKSLLKEREIMIKAKIDEKEKNGSKTETKKGLGTRKSTVDISEDSENPFL